ncbi:MAG: TetR/AcrR family transcriptional regulator [Nitrospirae bacterium]|nr:TetR/AcrR family transcriptional regulator [Nitrospirota bacterium]
MIKRRKAPNKAKAADNYHHGDLKAALLGTALKLLKKHSPAEISLRELARIAGVSQAAPYRHFKDKDDLLAELARQGFDMISQYMRETILKHKDDALNMYYGCGLAYFRMGLNHPQHFKLMFNSDVKPGDKYPALQTAASQTLALIRDMVVYCQKKKVFGEGEPLHIAFHCWSIVNGFTSLFADGRLEYVGVTAANAEEALKQLMSQFLIGAKRPLQESHFGFKIFETSESKYYQQAINTFPIVTDDF